MHVVVVVARQHLDDGRWPAQARVRADEDIRGAGGDEPVEQVLRERAVDLARARGWPLAPVLARVVDVGVEAVLVRCVARRPELGAELPPSGRDRSPMPNRGAPGCAAAYSPITSTSVRTSLVVP